MSESTGHEPAPGALALIEQFINSLDYPAGPDELATPEAAAKWLRDHASPVQTVSSEELSRLIDARERLRDLLEAHTGDNVDATVSVRLQGLLAGAPLRPELTPDGARLTVTSGGVDGFLGRIATAIVEATLTGTWDRLKVCRADTCRFAFYDHSKNGRGAWCSMRVCGSRHKARAYRERKRSSVPTPAV